MNWLEFGGQRSSSMWQHKTCFSWTNFDNVLHKYLIGSNATDTIYPTSTLNTVVYLSF